MQLLLVLPVLRKWRRRRRNPLTGLCGLQPTVDGADIVWYEEESQSPYGAMWFATAPGGGCCERRAGAVVAIPLRGYVVCNGVRARGNTTRAPVVAIPLRGYVVCNSTPLRTPFWTALPEGGL